MILRSGGERKLPLPLSVMQGRAVMQKLKMRKFPSQSTFFLIDLTWLSSFLIQTSKVSIWSENLYLAREGNSTMLVVFPTYLRKRLGTYETIKKSSLNSN